MKLFIYAIYVSAICCLLGTTVVPAQPATSILDHVIWEREYPDLKIWTVNSAIADRDGALWVAAFCDGTLRLLHISPEGIVLTNSEIPVAFAAKPPAT